MRTRKLVIAVAASSALGVFARRRCGVGGRQRSRRRSSRTRPRRSASRSSSRPASSIDDCQKAPSPILPADQRAHLGRHLVRRAARPACGSSPVPASRRAWTARTERIRNDLDDAEQRQGRGRDRCSREYQAPARRRQERGGPHHRGGPPGRPTRCKRDHEAAPQAELRRAARSGPPPTSRPPKAQAIADLRAEVAALAIGAAEDVVAAQPRPRARRPQLVENYINQVGSAT